MYNTGQSAVVVKDLSGKEYPAIAAVNRKRRVNGQREISLSFLYTEINKDFIKEMDFHWKILFGGEWYTVINPGRQSDGDFLQVNVTAVLSFFVDLNSYYLQDKAENKSMTPANFFRELFNGTPYNFVIVDELTANTLSYEDNQSKTERFLYAIDRFNAEYIVRGDTVYIHSLIGNDKDVILHEDLNVKSVSIDVDASGFHTWARGYGDLPDNPAEGEEEKYRLEVSYHSPLANKFGEIEGPAIKDGNYKAAASLIEAVKNQVENSYSISTEVDVLDLSNNGYPEMVLEEGDRVWLVVSKLNLNQQVRVVEIDETFDWEGNLIDAKYTVGNEGIAARYKTDQYNTLKDFKDILTGKKKIAADWLPDAIKRASDIINGNLDSHFKYGAGEIIGINKNNPNGYMRFNTDGLGFSRDGGKTYQTAMTYEGINANSITVGTLRGIVIEAVDIIGSTITSARDENNYIMISGPTFEMKGNFNRTWRGTTEKHDIRIRLQNGYIRARNDTKSRALYFSDFGISTFVDGEGESGSSGSLMWWDRTYSETGEQNGITLESMGGVVALRTNTNRIVVDAGASANIESSTAAVYLRPLRDILPGNNTFAFSVAESNNPSDTDGFLFYGSRVNGYASGIRFSKAESNPTVYITNGEGVRGGSATLNSGRVFANEIRKRDGTGGVYWNGSGTGTTSGTDYDTTLISAAIKTSANDFFIAVSGSGSVRVTNHDGYNSGNGVTYRPIAASEFNNASSARYKQNIRVFEENGMDIVKDHVVYTYYLESELQEGIYNNQQIGFISEAAPMLRKGETVSHYKAIAINWKATQELIDKVTYLEQRINDLETVVSV